MAVMTLKVVPIEGDAVSVPITPKVIVACERHFKKGMTQLFSAESASYEALAFAAHQAMMQSGHEVKTFDLWLNGIEEISTEETPASPL
jgi:hypothetical protein